MSFFVGTSNERVHIVMYNHRRNYVSQKRKMKLQYETRVMVHEEESPALGGRTNATFQTLE
jgi:hypothetical protein